jgi:hypothetical protein
MSEYTAWIMDLNIVRWIFLLIRKATEYRVRNKSEIPRIGLSQTRDTDHVLRKSDNSDADSESETSTDDLTAREYLAGR